MGVQSPLAEKGDAMPARRTPRQELDKARELVLKAMPRAAQLLGRLSRGRPINGIARLNHREVVRAAAVLLKTAQFLSTPYAEELLGKTDPDREEGREALRAFRNFDTNVAAWTEGDDPE